MKAGPELTSLQRQQFGLLQEIHRIDPKLATAQHNLGVMYAKGEGVEKDLDKAAELYEQAAAQGEVAAQYNLGIMYKDGIGVEKDLHKAAEFYKQAAAQGHAPAQCNLGVRYQNGEGMKKDLNKAVELYKQAAAQGYATAQYNLSLMYYKGDGVEKDLRQALCWTEQAAKQGHAQALHNLDELSECHFCGKSGATQWCGRCKKHALYCNRECQKAGWKVHKTSCSADATQQ